jgi:hypothetical protein
LLCGDSLRRCWRNWWRREDGWLHHRLFRGNRMGKLRRGRRVYGLGLLLKVCDLFLKFCDMLLVRVTLLLGGFYAAVLC